MRNSFINRLMLLFFLLIQLQSINAQKSEKDFSFIVSSDQREHATDKFHSIEYTLGGYEAIKKVGKGSFMVVLGDLDPPQATFQLIDKVIGKDYKRYVVVGNHDIEIPENLEYIRALNRSSSIYPNITRKGPIGCEETTYSFDWGNVHFIVLNVYYDGKVDNALDGNISPETIKWLEKDLKENKKKRVFIFGHEPLFPVLDMETGTIRHEGDALDKYPDNTLKFEQLLQKYKVTAYLSGHVHCASYSSINGLWLINSGHLYGQEGNYNPQKLFSRLSKEIEKEKTAGVSQPEAISNFWKNEIKEMKKFVFNLGYGDGKNYKNLTDKETLNRLTEFYENSSKSKNEFEKYEKLFWKNTEWRPSTFLKINVRGESATLKIYRDENFNGNYLLRHTQILYK